MISCAVRLRRGAERVGDRAGGRDEIRRTRAAGFTGESGPPGRLDARLGELEANLARADGGGRHRPKALAAPRRLLEMRYRGRKRGLTVPEPARRRFRRGVSPAARAAVHFTFPGRPDRVVRGARRTFHPPGADVRPRKRLLLRTAILRRPFTRDMGWRAANRSRSARPCTNAAACVPGARIRRPGHHPRTPWPRSWSKPGWTAEVTPHGDLLSGPRATRCPYSQPPTGWIRSVTTRSG